MKKFLSLVLALVLCLSLGATAFAVDDPPAQEEVAVTVGDTLEIPFGYVTEQDGSKVPNSTPEFTPTFTVVQEGNTPDTVSILPEATFNSETKNVDVKIGGKDENFPALGKYTFSVKQVQDTGYFGITADKDPVLFQVLVKQDPDGTKKMIVTITGEKGAKKASFTDVFKGTADLTIDKNVVGDMASEDVAFKIAATLGKITGKLPCDITYTPTDEHAVTQTEETIKAAGTELSVDKVIEIYLKHETGAVTIKGLPIDMAYTVKEDAKHTNTENEAGDANKAEDEGYYVTYAGGETNTDGKNGSSKGIIAKDTTVTVTNTKKSSSLTPDTGVILEFAPYVIILTLAVVGLIIFFVKRRKENED